MSPQAIQQSLLSKLIVQTIGAKNVAVLAVHRKLDKHFLPDFSGFDYKQSNAKAVFYCYKSFYLRQIPVL